MGDWNSEALEVNIWMETQGLTNKICNLHGCSDSTITYQRPKYCPINGIYCSAPLTEKPGRILILQNTSERPPGPVDLYKWKYFTGFTATWHHPSNGTELTSGRSQDDKNFNDTPHTSFVKHDIYQKIHYIHNRAVYPLPTNIARAFERLDNFITCLMHAADKNPEEKNRSCEMVT